MSHTCHADGCSREVPPRLFMCRPHWYLVPKPLRDEIWRHYRPGQEIDKQPSAAYLAVAKRAIAAVAAKEANAAGETQRALF